ncbi:MAG TPA: hypothetical protein VJU82_00315 [Acidobacteriaceae bacterium]|nr:hypothetical protein [Acidobacteriaceae bacterium]
MGWGSSRGLSSFRHQLGKPVYNSVGITGQVTRPHAHHQPPSILKREAVGTVALNSSPDLRLPPSTALRAGKLAFKLRYISFYEKSAVPKISINKNGNAGTRKNEIWVSWQA